MANRLEPLSLADFTGGLNLRKSTFQLNQNESPEMENIAIDPLGGIYTRKGWQRWNTTEIADPDTWDPRRAFLQQLADGTNIVYIASNHKLYAAGMDRTFAELVGVTCNAVSHMADFATFGDTLYIARGRDTVSSKRVGTAAPVALVASGAGNWNNDYVNPVQGRFPKTELVEAHAGYAFVANIDEDGTDLPNRLRWSHPTSQEDWAELDYIDIETGGAQITALMSYEDHLLIFKSNSVWALYGYNSDSWQLVQKSSTVGAMGPQGVSRNENVVFFYSAADRGGIYVYNGERPMEISTQLRRALEDITQPELIWVGWLGRLLWVTLPWDYVDGPTTDNAAVFVYDPSVGDGAWVYFTSTEGSLGPLVGGSNADTQIRPMGVLRGGDCTCVVRLDALEAAHDQIGDVAVLGVSTGTPSFDPPFLVTADDKEIIASGAPAFSPFHTRYRTPWLHADWPTRKKSWRRPDFVMKRTGFDHALQVRSFRDYEEVNPRRAHRVEVFGDATATWGEFDWGDGTIWGDDIKQGAVIRRGSSFGMAKALQLAIDGLTPGARWGIDAVILKLVMRRFR